MTPWLLLHVGERRCALPVGTVLAVAPAVRASPLPRAPAWIEGIAAYGRDVVPQAALAALLGSAGAGDLVVLAASGAGVVALRVDAVERVIELAAQAGGRETPQGPVAATVRHGQFDLALLDLSRLAIPFIAPRIAPLSQSHRSLAHGERQREAGQAPLDLICAVAGETLALPLARVLSLERAGADRVLHDPQGQPMPPGAAAMALTLSGAQGAFVLGVCQVVGLRRPGSPAHAAARTLDCDALVALASGEGLQSGAPAPAPRAMYLLGAGRRLALVPGSKALRVGPVEHWRALPGNAAGPDGILPVGGAILPGLDLGRLFGDPVARRSMAMAVEARGSRWAITCDSISERHGRIEGRPVTLDGLAMLGQARIAEGLVPVIDADRLVLPGLPS